MTRCGHIAIAPALQVMKKHDKALKLSRESIRHLSAGELAVVGGGAYTDNLETLTCTCIEKLKSKLICDSRAG